MKRLQVPYYVHNKTMDELNDWESFGKDENMDYTKIPIMQKIFTW